MKDTYPITYWVSSTIGTCFVETKQGVIIDTAPLWGKFIGQPLSNLTRWLSNKGLIVREVVD
jgi:hypothetical protein